MTPHPDPETAQEIAAHLNDSHADGVLNLARTFVSPKISQAQIQTVHADGLTLLAGNQSRFLPFLLRDADTREQVHYLIFYARVQQGALIDGGDFRYFTVLGSERVSPNMQRLTLKSQSPIPANEVGLAWYFTLHAVSPDKGRLKNLKHLFHRIVMRLLRHTNAHRRQKILNTFYQGKRYYTLRRVEKSSETQALEDIALVDVFLHGDTAGSQWARNIKIGDTVRSSAEYREQTAHLAAGQALLIGDETALPTVAALLENWQNPVPPIVISITQHPDDQAYLPDSLLPERTTLIRISAADDVAAAVTDNLKNIGQTVETAWGALEAGDANTVRRHLKQQFGLTGKQAKIKGYWRWEDGKA
ncbi:siderophore-interacting protein [Neisseria chenwenguii]|uniref:Uncharacterized protein n=1 Tax=Neisseria chenwenguii TaxID=1853278 RepID=A0A220S3X5_9NEIS|nr:siderophore-interacting protein [Neisseria chenwenguii]ASK28092.1 hypothetical protein BG910_10455 [Neisseria chenwenguii]ROV57243.1 siderophore-interacting protein [Neisseria chenwenguii]